MKRISILLLLLGSIFVSNAQDYFSLSLELVRPSGKLEDAYFLAKLKNHNDSLSFFIDSGGSVMKNLRYSYFKVIYDIGGIESGSNRKSFFDYGYKRYFLINPSVEYQVKLPLFELGSLMGENTGILFRSQASVRKIKRIRIKLENFEFMPMMLGTRYPKHLYFKKSIDLYSNWINIDAEEFVLLMKKLGIDYKPE